MAHGVWRAWRSDGSEVSPEKREAKAFLGDVAS